MSHGSIGCGRASSPRSSSPWVFLKARASSVDTTTWSQDVLSKLPTKDLKELEAGAQRKARRVLRSLSYTALPRGGGGVASDASPGSRAAAGPHEQRAAKAPAGAGRSLRHQDSSQHLQPPPPPLEAALAGGADARAARAVLREARRPLVEDGASLLCAERGSLDCVDVRGLVARMNEGEESPTCTERQFGVSGPRSLSPLSSDDLGRGFLDTTTPKARSPTSSAAWQPTPTLRRRNWPSLETFEEHYYPSWTALPRLEVPAATQAYRPLPSGRKSIANLNEALNNDPRDLALPMPPRQRVKERRSSQWAVPGSPLSSAPGGSAVGGAVPEPAEAYRRACVRLGARPLEPAPRFGDSLELIDVVADSTKQGYAIAEGIAAKPPREVKLVDAFLTDMGCERIVEAAITSGQVQKMTITGSCLNYRTCVAFYTSLRGRGGASLVALNLSECGLGGDMEEQQLAELPVRAAEAYARSRALLYSEAEAADEWARLPGGDRQPPENVLNPFGDPVASLEQQAILTSPGGVGSMAGDAAARDPGAAPTPDGRAATPPAVLPEVPSSATPIALPLLAHLARPGCALRHLDLSRTVLSLAAVMCVGRALELTRLEALTLDNCGITDDAMDAIAQGLAKNRGLLELKVRRNQLSGEPGAGAALLDAASRHPRLAHLDLAENLLPKESVDDLAAVFRWSCSLVAVHLLGDPDDPNAVHIADGCRRWVEENGAGETAVRARGPLEVEDRIELSMDFASEEVILCRTLHVEALSTWRMVAPPPRRPATPPGVAVMPPPEELVLQSWMPACCWVCERCVAVEYSWVVPDRGPGADTGITGARVFVRPSFADFARIELKRQRVPGAKRVHFAARLLLPPGQHCHVYESDPGADTKPMLLTADSEPAVEAAEASLTDGQRTALEAVCRLRRYGGRLNLQPEAPAGEAFAIPEPSGSQAAAAAADAPEMDPWAEDPTRLEWLRKCYDVDIKELHLSDLCHADEEAEVKETLWELYSWYYEAWAIVAGRSQWPLVRQVDVYDFFDSHRLLDRGPFGLAAAAATAAAAASDAASGSVPGSPSRTHSPAQPPTMGDAVPEEHVEEHLVVQDVQQILVQTVAVQESLGARRDPLARRAARVVQRTREGLPINRVQFIEVLLRAAIILGGRETSASVTFRRFAERVIIGRLMRPPLSPFPRGLAQQTGDFSDVLLARRKTIREAWERFGASENAFQALAQLLKICDRLFTAKHVASIYALARRPCPEAKQAQRAGLRYEEFCEAVARLALVWQRASSSRAPSQGGARSGFPAQPQLGRPVREKVVAARFESFLAKLADRMKPTYQTNPSLL